MRERERTLKIYMMIYLETTNSMNTAAGGPAPISVYPAQARKPMTNQVGLARLSLSSSSLSLEFVFHFFLKNNFLNRMGSPSVCHRKRRETISTS